MAAWGHRLHRIMTGQPTRWDTPVKAALKLHPPWRLPTGRLLAPGAIPEGVSCVLCVCWWVWVCVYTHIQGMRKTLSEPSIQYVHTHTHTHTGHASDSERTINTIDEGSHESRDTSRQTSPHRYGILMYIIIIIIYGRLARERAD
jgi:hypothetical protein